MSLYLTTMQGSDGKHWTLEQHATKEIFSAIGGSYLQRMRFAQHGIRIWDEAGHADDARAQESKNIAFKWEFLKKEKKPQSFKQLPKKNNNNNNDQ